MSKLARRFKKMARLYRSLGILFVFILAVVIYKIAFAVPPNPGHSLTAIGDATATYIPYGDGANVLASDANLTWDGITFYANGIINATTQYNIAGNFFGTQDIVNTNFRLGSASGGALIGGTGNTLIGLSAGKLVDEGLSNTVLGNNAGDVITDGDSNLVIGDGAGGATLMRGNENVLLGASSDTTLSNSNEAIALGAGAIAGSNQFVVGSTSASITGMFIGNGITNASPSNIKINATGGSGTSIAGASLTLAGGQSTGAGLGGSIIFQTSPADPFCSPCTNANGLIAAMTIDSGGIVNLGTAGTKTGQISFSGSTSGTITVNSAATAGTWAWTLPANDGDANQVLQTDGTGITSWATAGAGDMVLASTQTVTGAKTFGTIGGTVGKLILAGSTSGSSILNAAAVAGTTTLTLQGTTGTIYSSGGTDITLADGGTNASLTASNGAIVYSNTSALALTAVGSFGQILQSAGATTPVWTTATYPATADTSGNLLTSDGTNWASTAPRTIKQVVSAGTASITADSFVHPMSGSVIATTADAAHAMWIPYAVTAKNLQVRMTTAPSGHTCIVTLYKGASCASFATTTLTCTVASGTNNCADTSNSVSVSANDCLTIYFDENTVCTGADSFSFEMDY